ncbi:MAG: energy transducer TonB [Pseudomonadota bacterium]
MSDSSTESGAGPQTAPKSKDTLLLVLALFVVAGMLAWFFFGQDQQVVEDLPELITPVEEEIEPIRAVVTEVSADDELLSRARLAAEAGMLAAPAGSNALYYYVQYVEQNADDVEANDELQAVADRIGANITRAVDAGDWVDAATLVNQLNNAGVATAASESFDTQLTAYRNRQSLAALTAAQAGDEAAANAAIDIVAGLPRTQTGEVLELRSTVRDELVAKRLADQAAEQQAAQRRAAAAARAAQAAAASAEQTATSPSTPVAAEATAPEDPFAAVTAALADSQFSDAINAFQAVPASADGADAARESLVSAVSVQVRDAAARGNPDGAEQLRSQLVAVDSTAASTLEAVINRAYIEQATAETVSAAQLRRVSAVPPSYPRNALRRSLEGRVRVEFTVGVDGRTSEIEVVETTSSVFNRSATQAVSEWIYEPREVRGEVVPQRVYAFLEYNLE